MSGPEGDEDIVMVPVPRSKLGAVYMALGAAYMTPADPTAARETSAHTPETVDVYGQGPWTTSQVKHLEMELRAIPAIRALLTRLAEQAPAELTFEEAVTETQTSANLLRARLGSLSKISKRLFGATTWPMSVRYVEGGGAIYSMEPKMAEWWLEAVGQRA